MTAYMNMLQKVVAKTRDSEGYFAGNKSERKYFNY